MKHLSAITAITLLLTACGSKHATPDCKNTSVQATKTPPAVEKRLYISGTYVTTYDCPIAISTDTLRVEKIQNTATMYNITRRTAYRKILAGITQAPEVFTQAWTGSYDGATRTMYIIATGHRMRYNNGNELDLDGSAYSKVE